MAALVRLAACQPAFRQNLSPDELAHHEIICNADARLLRSIFSGGPARLFRIPLKLGVVTFDPTVPPGNDDVLKQAAKASSACSSSGAASALNRATDDRTSSQSYGTTSRRPVLNGRDRPRPSTGCALALTGRGPSMNYSEFDQLFVSCGERRKIIPAEPLRCSSTGSAESAAICGAHLGGLLRSGIMMAREGMTTTLGWPPQRAGIFPRELCGDVPGIPARVREDSAASFPSNVRDSGKRVRATDNLDRSSSTPRWRSGVARFASRRMDGETCRRFVQLQQTRGTARAAAGRRFDRAHSVAEAAVTTTRYLSSGRPHHCGPASTATYIDTTCRRFSRVLTRKCS